MAAEDPLKDLRSAIVNLERTMTREHQENRRFHDELMKRMERWSLAVEGRMSELSERINDQGDLIRAQTQALHRILDRLPPATS